MHFGPKSPILMTINDDFVTGHFRVPKTRTFKRRPRAKPFLWKFKFICVKIEITFFISMALQLASLYWNRGLGQLGNGPLIRKKNLERWRGEDEISYIATAEWRNKCKERVKKRWVKTWGKLWTLTWDHCSDRFLFVGNNQQDLKKDFRI